MYPMKLHEVITNVHLDQAGKYEWQRQCKRKVRLQNIHNASVVRQNVCSTDRVGDGRQKEVETGEGQNTRKNPYISVPCESKKKEGADWDTPIQKEKNMHKHT